MLEENGPTIDFAAAGATVTGAEGRQANKLFGFDSKNGTYCSGAAPRFDVQASTASTSLADVATAHRRRSRARPGRASAGTPHRRSRRSPSATIESVEVIMDEQGQALIDNVLANGNPLIGKPGNTS